MCGVLRLGAAGPSVCFCAIAAHFVLTPVYILHGIILTNNEWEGIWKEATNLTAVLYFKDISGLKKT
jgi:hypothetical protein